MIRVRQQLSLELVRRNTQQALLRPKQTFDKYLKEKAHAVVPRVCTRKLVRARRGTHKLIDVLQESRLYVLDSGQRFFSSA